MPNVVYSTRAYAPTLERPEGALVYLRTAEDNDALAWVDMDGNSVTESQFEILKAAECAPGAPALPRHENHHEIVAKGVKLIVETERSVGGQLGRPSGARFRTYERLRSYLAAVKGTLFATQDLLKAFEDIHRYPLVQSATDILNRQLKGGISDPALAELVIALRTDGRLCRVREPAVAVVRRCAETPHDPDWANHRHSVPEDSYDPVLSLEKGRIPALVPRAD